MGIKSHDGLHQSDIPFLQKIAHRQAVIAKAASSCNDKPHVREDKFVQRRRVISARQRRARANSSSRDNSGVRIDAAIYPRFAR
jgi:hypothetical protein